MFRLCSFILVFSLSSACVNGFETESAYDQQRYLCEAPNRVVYEEMIEDCRAERASNGTCGGVFSFEGIVETQAVTVESALHKARFEFRVAGSRRYHERLDLNGASPYFRFLMTIESIGVDSTTDTTPRVFELDRSADKLDEQSADNHLKLALRLTVGGDSVDQTAATRSGNMVLSFPGTGDEIDATFEAGFPDESYVRGCFHAFATERATEVESP